MWYSGVNPLMCSVHWALFWAPCVSFRKYIEVLWLKILWIAVSCLIATNIVPTSLHQVPKSHPVPSLSFLQYWVLWITTLVLLTFAICCFLTVSLYAPHARENIPFMTDWYPLVSFMSWQIKLVCSFSQLHSISLCIYNITSRFFCLELFIWVIL